MFFIFASAVAGPSTRAERGSIVTSVTVYPGAGEPVRFAAMGRILSATASRTIRSSPGEMETTSISGGMLMSSGERR